MKKTLITSTVLGFLLFAQVSCMFSPAQNPPAATTGNDTSIGSFNFNRQIDGLEYGQVNISSGNGNQQKQHTLAVIAVDPSRYFFRIHTSDDEKTAKTIKEVQEANDAVLTLNGSYFDQDFKPMGMLVSNGKILNDYKKSSLLNGILAIDNLGRPIIMDAKKIDPLKFPFAIQSGPILVNNRDEIGINKESGKSAGRTVAAIGSGSDGRPLIIFILIKQSLLNSDNTITLYQLAHMLKESPSLQKFNLSSAINLDGGTSTGFMIMDEYYPEFVKVQNIITVTKKTK